MNIKDTIECVKSYMDNLDTEFYHIVIVDNASPDCSGKELEEIFKDNSKITIMLNKKNLGFSAGNNQGIEYIQNNYEFEYLILSNNDIILYEKHLYEKVSQESKENLFAVMGPMILTADGRCDSNPIFDLPYTREAAVAQKRANERRLKLYESRWYPTNIKVNYLWKRFTRRFRKENSYDSKSRRYNQPELLLKKRDNIVLHGSFLIFSKKYFERFEGLDVRTFLYAEEDILYQHMKHWNMRMCYNPDIIVYHKEGKSVAHSNQLNREKVIFVTKNQIEAIDAYISLLDEYEQSL